MKNRTSGCKYIVVTGGVLSGLGKGIAAARLSTAGLGDTQPVGPNTTEEGRARKRRVVLIKQ